MLNLQRLCHDTDLANDVFQETWDNIRARAREAADKRSNIVKLKQLVVRRWAMPIAATASVVFVVSVVYETQFSSPRTSSVAVTTAMRQGATTPLQDDRALVAASPAPVRAKQRADAARTNTIQPPPPIIAPVASPPAIVSLAESISLAPPAPVIHVPLPRPTPSERAIVTNDLRQENKAQESKKQASRAAEPAGASAMTAPAQLLGKLATPADAKPSLASLGALVGHYNYESYRIIMLSGEVLGLKELGVTAATLDIDAEGMLTRRMTMTNGKVITQIAKVVEAKLGDNSGYWTVQWRDVGYLVQADISFGGGRLVSRTQFEDLADTPRFGSVELAGLRRMAGE